MRTLVALVVAASVLTATLAVGAQPAGKVWRIGFLGSTSPQAVHGEFLGAFRDGIRERGYVEGRNVTFEYRWAENDYERLPALAEELVRAKVDVILTHGSPGARAAKAATTTIPIVVAIVGDAVATGLVPSLARSGSNVTGATFSFPELNAKRLQILKEALPRLKRVAVLMNATNVGNVVTFEAVAKTARSIDVSVVQVFTKSAEEFEGAFAQIGNARAEAVIIYEDALFLAEAARLAALAERHRLPGIGFREFADAGGLLAFGVNFPAAWRRAAVIVDRVFKGARVSELPMEQPAKFDTVVNLKTAKALRLSIPRKVLLRADTVIE